MRLTAKWAIFLVISLAVLSKTQSTSASPSLKIAAGVVTNVTSVLFKWICSLNIPPPKTHIGTPGRSMIKFEGGYSVETVFDGRKLGIDPYTIAVSPTGELIILDSINSNVHKVSSPFSKYSRPKLLTGSLEGYTGHVDGKLREAKMHQPKGVAVDDKGNIYIADTMNMAIRKISNSGVVTTIAGGRMSREIDGSSEDAKFSEDFDVTYVRSSCSLLVVDRGSQVIREIHLQYGDCYVSEQPQSQDIEDNFNLVSDDEQIEEVLESKGLITPTMSTPSDATSPAAATQSITGKNLIEQKSELVDEIGVNARLAFQDAMSLKERMKDLVDNADKMVAQVGELRIGLRSAETRAQEAEQRLKEVEKSIADMKADQERMTREHADELASETGRIKMKYARICLRLSSAETRAQEAEQRLKEVQKSVAEMKADQERMTQEHADELASETGRIKTKYARIASDVGAYFSLKVRIEMMKEFQSDRHKSWNTSNEVADLQMLYPDGQPGVELLGLSGLYEEDGAGDNEMLGGDS